MHSFSQYLKESSADFQPALQNFQNQVLSSSGHYTSLNNLKTAKVISANDARQELVAGGMDDPDEVYPHLLDDSKYVYVSFSSGPGRFGLLVSISKSNGDIVMGKSFFYGHEHNIFKGFRWEQIKNEKRFKNVTVYLTGGMGNIIRVDCRELVIQVGKYAQYDRAILVKYLQKGKQKWQGIWATYDPFVVVVPTDKAINPDSLFGDAELSSTPGVTVKKGRYSSFDPRWKADFVDQMKAHHVPVVWSHEDKDK